MTEEELKAIENYKMFEDAIKQTISKGDRELYIDNLEAALRDTRILLNLIEKQQEEIEHYKNKYEQEQMKKQDMINQIQQLEEEAREIELQNLED